jgi:hypothetical protein
MEYLIIALSFAIPTAVIGRRKGSSFFIWLLIGFFTLAIGLVAAILYRREQSEPERRCPNCGKVQKLYVQVCSRCGEDLYLPEADEVRPGPDHR